VLAVIREALKTAAVIVAAIPCRRADITKTYTTSICHFFCMLVIVIVKVIDIIVLTI